MSAMSIKNNGHVFVLNQECYAGPPSSQHLATIIAIDAVERLVEVKFNDGRRNNYRSELIAPVTHSRTRTQRNVNKNMTTIEFSRSTRNSTKINEPGVGTGVGAGEIGGVAAIGVGSRVGEEIVKSEVEPGAIRRSTRTTPSEEDIRIMGENAWFPNNKKKPEKNQKKKEEKNQKKKFNLRSKVVHIQKCERMLCLAMHYQGSTKTDPDTVRLNALLKMQHIDNICSVSDYPNDRLRDKSSKGHIYKYFDSEKNLTDMLLALKPRERQPDIVCLDYFWLHPNYYNKRYGENWVEKVSLMFQYWAENLQVVILPIDTRYDLETQRDNVHKSSILDVQFTEEKKKNLITIHKNEHNQNLHIFQMSAAESATHHPLAYATLLAQKELSRIPDNKGRIHKIQIKRIEGFVCISKMKKEKLFKYLQNLCPPNNVCNNAFESTLKDRYERKQKEIEMEKKKKTSTSNKRKTTSKQEVEIKKKIKNL